MEAGWIVVIVGSMAFIGLVAYQVGWDRGNRSKRCLQCEKMARAAVAQQIWATEHPSPLASLLAGLPQNHEAVEKIVEGRPENA